MKVMAKDRVVAENQVEHIQQERKLLQKVEHPCVVALEYAFHTQDSLFLVMEFCRGGDLYETMRARPESASVRQKKTAASALEVEAATERILASEAQAVVTALVCVGPQARRSVRGSVDCNWRPQLRRWMRGP